MECCRSLSPWKNSCSVRSGHHDRGSLSRFSGARTYSNNTAEKAAMIEALSFLGPLGAIAVIQIRVFVLTPNMLQDRRHVQLAFACQQSMLKVNHRLRFSTQHVCSHTVNLGNECAHHAAAFGALGLVSSHNLSTRLAHHSFDTAACFASCNNIGDVLEKLHDITSEITSTSQHQNGR